MSDTYMVVVSYKNPKLTIKAVESLLNQTHDINVVVHDNYSTLDNRAELQDALRKHKNVFIHGCATNALWTPAINARMSNAWAAFGKSLDQYKYVGFMNNDIVIPPHGIESMIEVLQDDKVGIVAPHGSSLGGNQDFASHYGQVDEAIEFCKTLEPIRTTYVVGAFMLMRTDTWFEVGELDEKMPLGADDHDYCIRVKQAGKQIWIDQRVYASHVGHATQGSSEWKEHGKASWDHFNEKWSGYFQDEEEAIKSHWGGKYIEGFDK